MTDLSPADSLFPNDVPKDVPKDAPEWFAAQRHQAKSRLAGSQLRGQTTDPAAAALLLASDAPKGTQTVSATDQDPAKVLFPTDADHYDDRAAKEFFDGFQGSAIADGDIDRARELGAAKDAMVADFKAAGTDPADLRETFDIVRERQGDTLTGPVSEEKLAADNMRAMAELTAEGMTDADLSAARRFIRDLDKIAPGTIASLETTGAGNDPRLRKAITEARRRGY